MKQPEIKYIKAGFANGYKHLSNFHIDEEIEFDKINQRFEFGSFGNAIAEGFVRGGRKKKK